MMHIGARLLSLPFNLLIVSRRHLPKMKSGVRVALILCALSVATVTTFAQNVQFTQGSVGSGLDNSISIPLGGYPGRGAASLPVNISYSSQVWRIGHLRAVYETIPGYSAQARRSVTEAIYAEYSTAGWRSSLDIPKIEWPKADDLYWYTGKPYYTDIYPYTFRVARVFIHMPDGSTHELRKSDQPYRGAIDMYGTFYAVDASRLRYDSTGESTGTLYLPDGTRYILNTDNAKYIDRHGNTLNYNPATRQWTDTLGRIINVPLPSAPSIGPIPYTLPGINNTQVTYIFHWKRLADVLAQNAQGQTPVLMNLSSHYLPNPGAMPTNQGAGNFPEPAAGASLFHSEYPDEEAMNVSSYTYVVGRGQAAGQLFNPVVLAEIELPNHLRYTFGYNNYGEITKVTYPSGAYDLYEMGDVPSLGRLTLPYTEASRGVTKRLLSADGSGQDYAVWEYFGGGSSITTKAPDGTVTDVYRMNITPTTNGEFWPFGLEDARHGMTVEERIYAPNLNPSGPQDFRGAMLRRKLTNWATSQYSIAPRPDVNQSGNNTVSYQRNARPDKEVSLVLDTGGDALAKTITYTYDLTYQMSTGIDMLVSTESEFSNLPSTTAQTEPINIISPGAGIVESSAETAYLNDADYRNRHILGLATSVVLKDANGQVVSKTEKAYDEAAYPLLTYGDLSGVADYTDPLTTKRGNVTTVRRYTDIAANLYLETHAHFDQCGNAWKAKNERGIESQTEYSSTYKHAYATTATTVAPDPSGQHGASAGFTSSSIFDYTTGLVLSSTDANGQTITYSYRDEQNVLDPMNRLRKVTRPDGGWTSYYFNDELGDLYTLTKTKQDATRVTESRQYFDEMGRSSRALMLESGTTYLATETQYDELGRVSRSSNPHRTQGLNEALDASVKWTTNTYDALGRVTQVNLPDNTSVQTSYQGVYTTATDQSGKSRRQLTNSLGRIVRVDEPDANGNLGGVDTPAQATYYDYDTQGNLIHVVQGAGNNTQHRYFKYDALSRLTYEKQVEQTGVFNLYDPLTQNSYWSRRIVYDENNYQGLVTSLTDARQVQTQLQYDQLNRVYQISYTDSTPTVTNYYDQARTGYFNKGHLTQATTAAVAAVGQVAALPSTSQVYDFDLMGRTKRQQQQVDTNNYVLSYDYNLAGQLTAETYPSGRVVSYAYGDAARLTSVSSGASVYASQFVYGTKGLLSSLVWGNGAIESYDYNDRLQVTEQSLVKDNVTVQRYQYAYGQVNATTGTVDATKNNGQLGRIESFIGTQKQWQQRFQYDSLGRFSSASEYRGDNNQRSYLVNYGYDRFGNRSQSAAANPVSTNPLPYTPVGDADTSKLTNQFLSGLTYDAAGNVIRDEKFRQLQFKYDANGRQQWAANLDNSDAVTAIYDGAGQRVATKSGNTLGISVYDAFGKLVAEYGQGAGTSGRRYVFADLQGSPRVVMTASDSSLVRHDYQAFGEELSAFVGLRTTAQGYDAADGVRQKYAGMEGDDSGLNHTLWRQYESRSGRWTAPDPYGGSMTLNDPQSFNRYSYVNNDPVNHVDALGLMLSDIGIVQTQDESYARTLQGASDAVFQRSVNRDYQSRHSSRAALSGLVGGIAGGLRGSLAGSGNGSNTAGSGGNAAHASGAAQGSGQQLSPCLRNELRPFFPKRTAQGKEYSPIDDARFTGGVPWVYRNTTDPDAITLGLYDIYYSGGRRSINGGTLDDLKMVIEEVTHTEQFLSVWDGMGPSAYSLWTPEPPTYEEARAKWKMVYVGQAAAVGFSYDNALEKVAKAKVDDVLKRLQSDPNHQNQAQICGFQFR